MMLCCRSEEIDEHPNYNDVVDTFYSHSRLEQIRKDMLEGKSIPECSWCHEQESYRNTSGRTQYTSVFYNRFPELTKEIFNTGKPILKTFDIKFGNICNQACVMCSPYVSSLIAKEQNKPIIDHNTKNLDRLKTISNDIVRFKTTGGEPTLQPGFKYALDLFIETNTAKNIQFSTVTNGTVDISKYVHKMSKFKDFSVNFSLDAISEDVYSYVRYPGNVKKVLNNQTKFINAVVDNDYIDNVNITFNCVVHALNITEIYKIIEYIDSIDNSELEVTFNLEPVIKPAYLHASLVDRETLEAAIIAAKNVLSKCTLEKDDVDAALQVLNYFESHTVDNKKQLLKELDNKVKYWKQVRKLDGYQLIPHLNKTISNENID